MKRTVAPGRTRFDLVRGRAGFDSLRSHWKALLAEIAQPHFFHRYEWFEAILDAWPEEAGEILFVVAYRDGGVAAICPLHVTRTRVMGVRVRVLEPLDPNAISYPDFICADSARDIPLFHAAVDTLRSCDVRWDLLVLAKTFGNSPALHGVRTGYGMFAHRRDTCYYFECDRGFDYIQSRMSSGLRKHLRRCRRQLAGLGVVESISSREPDQLPALFDEFMDVEASGWKGAHGEGTALRLHDDLVEFYGTALRRFASTSECEINLLRLNGRAIAGQFCLLSGGTWYHLKIAYDEAFDRYSPGFVLLEDVLERLCRDPRVHTANYLTGAEWASRWHPQELDVMRVIATNRTAAGLLALRLVRARRYVRERVLPALARLRRRNGRSAETE